jgi:uncharacterized membrane protein YraQ (UPF0718 family)
LASAAIMLLAALALVGHTAWRGRPVAARLRAGVGQALALLPRLILALLAAGFVERLVPVGEIASLIGASSGFGGIVIAAIAGSMVPSGPMISFPLMLILSGNGAGAAQLIAFLVGWATLALHRVFMFEVPLLGPRFAALRLLVSLPIPLLAGFAAWAVLLVLG